MSTIGPLFCGTGASYNDGGTTGWTNPTNIQGDTTSTAATCSIASNGGTSYKLRASNFGFTGLGGATVNGITVEIERNSANNNRQYENNVQLLKGGIETGDNKSDGSAIQTTKEFKTFGGSADGWNAGLAGSDITSSGFGVSFKISRSSVSTTTTSVYRVRITVDYTSAGFSADAVIKKTQSPTGSASDAVIKANSGTKTLALDAWKRADIYLNAIVLKTQSLGLSWAFDAVVKRTQEPTGLLANAVHLQTQSPSFLIGDATDPGGAWITEFVVQNGNFKLDAVIYRTWDQPSFSAQSIKLESSSFTDKKADAVVQRTQSLPFLLDAVILRNSGTLAITANAVFTKTIAPLGPTIQRYQTGYAGTGSPTVVSWTGAGTSGNTLLVYVAHRGNGTAGTVSGWTRLWTRGGTDSNVLYAKVSDGTETGLSFNWSGGDAGGHFILIEVSGASFGSLQNPSVKEGSGTSLSTNAVTPTAGASALLVAYWIQAGDWIFSYTEGGGYTWLAKLLWAGDEYYHPHSFIEYRYLTNASGSYTPTATASGGDGWAGSVVSLSGVVFAANSVVIANSGTKTFSISAVLLRTQVKSFLIGDEIDPGGAWISPSSEPAFQRFGFQQFAFQVAGFGKFSVDAFIDGTLRIESTFKKVISDLLLADSTKKKTQSSTFTIDWQISIRLDAWLALPHFYDSFSANAFIPFSLRAYKRSLFFTADAWVHGGRFTLNAWIGKFTRVLYLYENRDTSSIDPVARGLYLYENRSSADLDVLNRDLYLYENRDTSSIDPLNRDLYLYENRTLPTTNQWSFYMSATKRYVATGSFTIDSHIPTTIAEPFYLDAITVAPLREWSFFANSDIAGANEKRGTLSGDAWVRGTGLNSFQLSSLITMWVIVRKSFSIDGFIRGWFTASASITTPRSFTIQSLIVSAISSFTADSLVLSRSSRGLQTAVLESTPAAYFPFTDPVGSSTVQELVSSKHGTLTNGASGAQFGTYAGVRQGATIVAGYVTTSFYQTATMAVSVEFWMKTTGVGEIWQGRYGAGGGAWGKGITVSLSANGFSTIAGRVNVFVNSDALWYGQSSNVPVNDGNLHHVVAIWNSGGAGSLNSSQFYIYIDGQAVSTYNNGEYGSSATPLAGNTGAYFLGAAYQQYTGFISDLAVYQRALTPTEIFQHYEAGFDPGTKLTADSYVADANGAGPGMVGNLVARSTITSIVPGSFLLNSSLSLSRTFPLDALIRPRITVDAFIGCWFAADAYIKGNSYIVFPDEPTDPTTIPRPTRSFKIRILIALRHPELVDLQQTTFWFNAVCTMQKYVNTYEDIPEAKRTAKQQAALETDLKTLAYNKTRWRQAMDTPVTWTDYTESILWAETSFTQMARVGAGTFEAKLRGDFPEIKGGEEIVVEVDDFRVFGGYITQIEQTYFFENKAVPKTILRGTDYNALFTRLTIYNQRQTLGWYAAHKSNGGGYVSPKSYPRYTSDRDILVDVYGDLIQMDLPLAFDYSTYVDAVDTPAPVVPWLVPGPDNTLLVLMQSIVQVTNAIFFIDPYMSLHYHDRTTVTAPYPITDGAGGISCRNLSITEDISQLKNDVFVWGTLARTVSGDIIHNRSTGDGYADVRYWKAKVDQIQKYVNTYLAIPASERTAKQQAALTTDLKTLAYNKEQLAKAMATTEVDSVGTYGYWQFPEMRTDIHHQEWVDKRAMAILYHYQMPIITAKATIFDPGFNAGQVVTLKSASYGIETNLVIRSVRISFPISQGKYEGDVLAVPMYELTMGLDPETGWNIYDYLPFEGFNIGLDAR